MSMNFELSHLPQRTSKPRNSGFTMVMDKGLSVTECENLVEASGEYIDIIKLGFGSSLITPNLDRKLAFFKEAGIPVYFGGTLLEAFIVRGQFDDYLRLMDRYKMEYAEVSDGSITMPHPEKLHYIHRLSKRLRLSVKLDPRKKASSSAPTNGST